MAAEMTDDEIRNLRLHGLDDALEICEDAMYGDQEHLSELLISRIEEIFRLCGVVLVPAITITDSAVDVHDRILDMQTAYIKPLIPTPRIKTKSRR